MGVYTSNTYNPLGAIQAGINNVNERNRIKNEYWKRKGEIWSKFAEDMGKLGTRMIDGFVANSEGTDANSPEARLEALEKELKDAEEAERIQAIQDKYNEQVAPRRAIDEYLKNTPEALAARYAEAIRGYTPNFGGYNYNQFQGGVYPEQEMQDFYVGGFNA